MIRFICLGIIAVVFAASSRAIAQEQFQPNWDSLAKQQLPEWVKDAKFVVYTHWGVFSVPAHGGPDYVRNLYEGSRKDAKGVYSYHTEKYGALKDFGYKDFIPQYFFFTHQPQRAKNEQLVKFTTKVSQLDQHEFEAKKSALMSANLRFLWLKIPIRQAHFHSSMRLPLEPPQFRHLPCGRFRLNNGASFLNQVIPERVLSYGE